MSYTIDLRRTEAKKIRSLAPSFCGKRPGGRELSFSNYYMEIDRKPFFAAAGEIHFSRMWEGYWEDEILKMKTGGINIVSTYIFWNHHEEEEGVFDFSGRRDLRKFVELCGKHDLYVIARIGPFCHGEVRNGGLPDWLYGKPFEARSLDETFLSCVRRLYRRIGRELAGLFYQDGGPVIAAQLDNEYMASAAPWERSAGTSNEWVPGGHDGSAYLLRLRDLAREAGIEPPVYTCTGWGAPVTDDILPLWGGYAYWPWIFYPSLYPSADKMPKKHPATEEYLYRSYHSPEGMKTKKGEAPYHGETRPYCCCEMGGGMFCSYHYRFQLPFESVDAMANIKIGSGCNFLGYYMYHGGTNPKGRRTPFLNEGQTPQLSYDFQAALGEFGQARPSYHRLRALHLLAESFTPELAAAGTVLPENAGSIAPEDTGPLRFALRVKDGAGFLFINNFQDHAENAPKKAESITLLLDGREPALTIGPFSLAAGENCVLPFNLGVRGIPLKYALAQPLTVIDSGGEPCAFFFVPEGMEGAYFFADGVSLQGEWGEPRIEGSAVHCPSGKMSVFVAAFGGKRARFVTLTRKQSLGFYRCVWHGAERALLTEGTLMAAKNGVRIEHDRPALEYGIFPDAPPPSGAVALAGEGPFTRCRLEREPVKLEPRTTQIGAGRYLVSIPRWDAGKIKDVILRIAYEGDIGHAFIDGDMIADNFWNGAVWEIGLREFAERLQDQPLTIYITPAKKESSVTVDSSTAARLEEASGVTARLVRADLQARYEWALAE